MLCSEISEHIQYLRIQIKEQTEMSLTNVKITRGNIRGAKTYTEIQMRGGLAHED